jgi:hypothetical protein
MDTLTGKVKDSPRKDFVYVNDDAHRGLEGGFQ